MRIIIIILFCLLKNVLFAQETKRNYIDLRNDIPLDGKNYVGFGVRTNTTTGHAFVIVGRENVGKMVSEVDVIGFYPDPLSAGRLYPLYGEGTIKNEFKSKNWVADFKQIYFVVGDKEYAQARKVISYWTVNPGTYNFATNNCMDLIQAVMGKIGIRMPPSFGATPDQFYNSVLNVLNTTGLEYLKTKRILYHNDSSYVGDVKNGLPNGDGRFVYPTEVYWGKIKDGKIEGLGEMLDKINGSRWVSEFNHGVPDLNKTVRKENFDGTLKDRPSVFINKRPQYEELYAGGSKRVYQVDTSTGKLIQSTFIGDDGTTILERYFTGDSIYVKWSNKQPVFSYEGDVKLKFELGYRKYYFNGRGILRIDNNVWQGDFKNGRLDGKNIHTNTGGDTFDGEIWYEGGDSFMYGYIKFANGDIYIGNLKNFLFNGRGRLIHDAHAKTFLGIRIGNNKSFDVEDVFSNGISPSLQKSGFIPPAAAMEKSDAFKVKMDMPKPIVEKEKKMNPPTQPTGFKQEVNNPHSPKSESTPSKKRDEHTNMIWQWDSKNKAWVSRLL